MNESDYNNIIEILQSAEKMFNKKILQCQNGINRCKAYINKIYVDRETDIEKQLYYINKPINIWTEGHYTFLLDEKENYFYKARISKFSSSYNEALNFLNEAYKKCTYSENYKEAKEIRTSIELCNINILNRKGM